MSNTWPTISREAQIEGFRQFVIHDPTLRSKDADGRPLARSGTARILYGWEFHLRHMSTYDKNTLKAFQDDTVRIGGETFLWTDPTSGDSGDVFVVRLAGPMEFEIDGDDDIAKWRTTVTLHEEPGS